MHTHPHTPRARVMCTHTQEMERLKEWHAVSKRVEAERLHEEQEGRAMDRLAAEQQHSTMEHEVSTLKVRARGWPRPCAT